MSLLKKIIFVLFVLISTLYAQDKIPDFTSHFKNLPFKMKPITVPKFLNKTYNIKKYGAVGDGLTINTKAFEDAIKECSKNGGGKVIVPAGIWLTGPIFFKDNVNLYLETGAFIQFSNNYSDYPLIQSNWEGYSQFRCTSPIMGKNLKNIAITGNGIIDGAGQVWRPVKKFKLSENDWKALVKTGGVVKGDTWWPTPESLEASELIPAMKNKNETLSKIKAEKYKVFFRPVLLNFVECKNVLLDGVTFQNSPAWNLHPLLCENVIFSNLNVRNPWYSQNGDGIDVESCSNTLIYNCRLDVGDDAICIKSGRDEEGRKRNRPTENLIIVDCVVYHGHGGVTVGSEMSGGVRNVKVDNCNFIGTDVGLRFKSTRGRGGIVEDIWISNIYMKDIPTEALSFNLFYGGLAPAEDKSAGEKSKNALPVAVNETTPSFRNIHLKNIVCIGAKDAIVMLGLPEMPLKGIDLENISITSERGVSIYDAESITFKNAGIYSNNPTFYIRQGRGIILDNVTVRDSKANVIKLEGFKTKNIVLKGKSSASYFKKTTISPEVPKNVLKVQ